MNQQRTEQSQGQFFHNQVVLIGRAGSDAEIRYFDNGKAKASVSLAVNRYVSKQEKLTDWFRIEFWDREAEVAADYVKKGSQIAIEGYLSLNRWQDSQTGVEKEAYSINCTNLRLLGGRSDQQQ